MTNATQDPARPHVTWFSPDPRDARLAELTTALQRIRTLAGDYTALEAWTDNIIGAIHKLAADALAGAETDPCAAVVVALAI